MLEFQYIERGLFCAWGLLLEKTLCISKKVLSAHFRKALPHHLYEWISIRKKLNHHKTSEMLYPSWIKMIPIPRDTKDSLSNRFM